MTVPKHASPATHDGAGHATSCRGQGPVGWESWQEKVVTNQAPVMTREALSWTTAEATHLPSAPQDTEPALTSPLLASLLETSPPAPHILGIVCLSSTTSAREGGL